jgi:hypothetical protein
MRGLRGRLERIEREMKTEYVTVEHEDGTRSKWPLGDGAFEEVFGHEYGRWTQDDPGPAHPFVVALRTATNLEALMAEHGTVLGNWVGEDTIIRGKTERPGPPVTWSEDGTVCS